MGDFVLDASTALRWFLEDEEDRSYSLAILRCITDDYRPLVPWLWYYEVSNSLLRQTRRKRISFENMMEFLGLIDEMEVDIDFPSSSAILQLPYLAKPMTLAFMMPLTLN